MWTNIKKACNAKTLQAYSIWCRNQESNSGPTDYKSVALPTELLRRSGHSIKATLYKQDRNEKNAKKIPS